MNMSLARQQYTIATSQKVEAVSSNVFAISLAMQQLIDAMHGLTNKNSVTDTEKHFEMALTRIYILQKCLDFENGGELARNLFRVYEHARNTIIGLKTNKKSTEELKKAIEFIKTIHEGWSAITKEMT